MKSKKTDMNRILTALMTVFMVNSTVVQAQETENKPQKIRIADQMIRIDRFVEQLKQQTV
jgi:hypothetical protein